MHATQCFCQSAIKPIKLWYNLRFFMSDDFFMGVLFLHVEACILVKFIDLMSFGWC